MAGRKRYRVEAIPNKGRGVRADVEEIKPGTEIMLETPLFSIPVTVHPNDWDSDAQEAWFDSERSGNTSTIANAVHAFPPADRALFDSLYAGDDPDLTAYDTDVARVERNYFSLPTPDYTAIRIVVFRETCFINHSCRPNAAVVQGGWEAAAPDNRVIALTKIRKHDEITIDYCTNAQTYTTAHDRAQQFRNGPYKFTCDCVSCNANRRESDRNRAEMLLRRKQLALAEPANGEVPKMAVPMAPRKVTGALEWPPTVPFAYDKPLKEEAGKKMKNRDCEKRMWLAERQCELLVAEGILDVRLAEAYHVLAKAYVRNENFQKALAACGNGIAILTATYGRRMHGRDLDEMDETLREVCRLMREKSKWFE
ncbi:SET domain-containing protein [Mytilinidion resinicola]|uniref:SET domain-containing protein n=1 Tax=Mytilinidion resinicola TaxID=574789 RepID=A0A6A6YD91_9PEZI|nr:SET domain-containing protein [Mytilinidion resinicola]KAF2806569.1 SET domain-containing protein [Mytilinidion resinicola]